MAALDLVAEHARLQAEVTEHKREIGRRRRRLQAAAAQLEQVRAECERRGIRLIVLPPPNQTGEGVLLHGRPTSD